MHAGPLVVDLVQLLATNLDRVEEYRQIDRYLEWYQQKLIEAAPAEIQDTVKEQCSLTTLTEDFKSAMILLLLGNVVDAIQERDAALEAAASGPLIGEARNQKLRQTWQLIIGQDNQLLVGLARQAHAGPPVVDVVSLLSMALNDVEEYESFTEAALSTYYSALLTTNGSAEEITAQYPYTAMVEDVKIVVALLVHWVAAKLAAVHQNGVLGSQQTENVERQQMELLRRLDACAAGLCVSEYVWLQRTQIEKATLQAQRSEQIMRRVGFAGVAASVGVKRRASMGALDGAGALGMPPDSDPSLLKAKSSMAELGRQRSKTLQPEHTGTAVAAVAAPPPGTEGQFASTHDL
eukprot:g2199.t1